MKEILITLQKEANEGSIAIITYDLLKHIQMLTEPNIQWDVFYVILIFSCVYHKVAPLFLC